MAELKPGWQRVKFGEVVRLNVLRLNVGRLNVVRLNNERGSVPGSCAAPTSASTSSTP